MDSSTIVMSVITGSIGMGYIVYGKKQSNYIAFLSGILLCITPYILNNIIINIIAAFVYIILPFVIKV